MAAVLSEAAQMDHLKTIVLTVPAHSAETEAAARSEPSEVLAAMRIAIAIAVDSAIAIAVDSEADLPPTADHPLASPLVLLLQTAVRLVEIVAAVLSEAEAAMVPVRLAVVQPAARAATAAEAISVEEDRANLRKMES